ncbi:MAG: peptidase C45 [Acidobacteria bacterium]|nr:peptidase C45 [Acidobacteriota bacterium]
MRLFTALVISYLLAGCSLAFVASNKFSRAPKANNDSRLEGSYRRPADHGWTFVHLAGTPSQIGFQHGYLLAAEIEDTFRAIMLELTHNNKKDWQFFRSAAQAILWPHIEPEYREELLGIAQGATAKGVQLDVWDVVALNAANEWSYYVQQYDKQHGVKSASLRSGERCSAFVATGSYTADGQIVIAHNNWSEYLDGERWTIIFDIVPAKGLHIIMDGGPGFIHSGDDFGINSAGIVITETTIDGFFGFDTTAVPEFVRARKAMQYSRSIDDFTRLMSKGNNGGYANDWLVADVNKNEIASLELGLKNVTLQRQRDGYFVSSNFPISEKLTREETDFDIHNPSLSANARHTRWKQLMAENKGRIDLQSAEKFESDHYDAFDQKIEPDERTLCGHIDLSARGSEPWQPPFGIAGTVQNKATTAAMARQMSFVAAAGHACGIDFKAGAHLQSHPEFTWQKELLRDMDSQPWSEFRAPN